MCNYWHYSIYVSIFYVVSIFSIQRWMRNRERYNLRRYLFAWSLGLSIFSAIGFYRCGLGHITSFLRDGFEASICIPNMLIKQPGLWGFLFILSKLPELVDTYFIVLRKQKLIFLHWYHHITVFTYCWYHLCYRVLPGQWFLTMNYFIHSVMYFYYAVRASGLYRPPIWINMVITMMQLLQMVVGVTINVYVALKVKTGWVCDGEVEHTYFYVAVALTMYFSYFLLFAIFFYSSYCGSKQKSTKKEEETNKHISNGFPPSLSYQTGSNNDGQLRHR